MVNINIITVSELIAQWRNIGQDHFMPANNRQKPLKQQVSRGKGKSEFMIEYRKTSGPYDMLDIFCVGVRIGQFTLIHGQPAKDFMEKIRATGVEITADSFKE